MAGATSHERHIDQLKKIGVPPEQRTPEDEPHDGAVPVHRDIEPRRIRLYAQSE